MQELTDILKSGVDENFFLRVPFRLQIFLSSCPNLKASYNEVEENLTNKDKPRLV